MSQVENYWRRRQQRRVSRRRFLGGAGVAAAGSAAILAGCGGDPPAPPPVATEAPTATADPASPTPTATPTSPPTPPPRRGGTLRLWKPAADDGLDPGIYHLNNQDILYSTLTQPLTYQPTKHLFAMDGMVGYEQVDPVTLVWNIRPGMRFHNGDPVDSEAVAFSFGRVQKLYDLHRARVRSSHVRPDGFDFVDSFEAADALTLTEQWRRPTADALVHRARHYYSFLNPRVVERQGGLEGVYEHPDGTTEDVLSVQNLPFGSGSGPYVATKRDETGTRVERWPDYHMHTPADDGFVEEGPYIEAWETRILADRDAARAAFLAGELDVFDAIDADEVSEFSGATHLAATDVPSGEYSMLGMDGLKFHDRRARQALRKVLDYEAFISALGPRGGKYVAPIAGPLPHFQGLTQQQLRGWYRHDPKEARALWEVAEFEFEMTPLQIHQLGDGDSPQFAASQFAARSIADTLGIGTEVRKHPTYCQGPIPLLAAFASVALCTYPGRGEPRRWDLFSYGTHGSKGTSGIPSDFLNTYDPRLGQFNFYAESPHKEIAEDSVEISAMLEAQEQELEFDARVELLTEIQRWILDRAWCNLALPVSNVSYYGFNSRLRDHAPDDWLNYYGLRRESMWLADV